MSYSIISPRPLPVVFAMSVGQGIGILAFLCYLLAVVIDVGRRPFGSSLFFVPSSDSATNVDTAGTGATPS